MSIAAIILAAGRSTRMGSNKLMEDLQGKPLVRHVADAALASIAHPVLVVTGHEAERVRKALEGLDVEFVHNPNFTEGLSTSLKMGVLALSPDVSGALILLGDMPLITSQTIDDVIAAFEASPHVVGAVPVYHSEWGNPVLLSRRLFDDVVLLTGDAGARKLLGSRINELVEVTLSNDAILIDLDTKKSLAQARGENN